MASQQELTEARAALHQLMTGKKALKLQQNGRSAEYQAADVDKLRLYISELEQKLDTTTVRRRPGRFY